MYLMKFYEKTVVKKKIRDIILIVKESQSQKKEMK